MELGGAASGLKDDVMLSMLFSARAEGMAAWHRAHVNACESRVATAPTSF